MSRNLIRLGLILASMIIGACCCFCPLSPVSIIAWDGIVIPLWINLSAPNPVAINLPEPKLLHSDISSGAHSIYWSDDGSLIFVIGTDSQVSNEYPDNFMMTVDASSGEILDERRVTDDFDFEKEYNITSQFSEIDEERTLWDTCPSKDLMIIGRELPGTAWDLELWQAATVIDTFRLDSDQWSGLDSAFRPYPAGAALSPTCEHFAVGLYGWIYWEGDGQEELWLVDLPDRSIQRVLKGRWTFSRLWDYPVQDIDPSWSPDGDEIVFGDSRFGLEIYDIKSGNRRWLSGPGQSGYSPQWSPSGQWIAVERYGPESSVIVISTDSKWTDYIEGCDFISAMSWASSDDRFAYLCSGKFGESKDLYVWSLPSEPESVIK